MLWNVVYTINEYIIYQSMNMVRNIILRFLYKSCLGRDSEDGELISFFHTRLLKRSALLAFIVNLSLFI